MKRNLEGVNSQIFSQRVENWLIFSPFSVFIPYSRRRAEQTKKYFIFNECVRVLTWLFPLPFEETHFYSWSQSSLFMTLHTCVFCQNLKKKLIKLQLWLSTVCTFILTSDWQLSTTKGNIFFFPLPKWRCYTHTSFFCENYRCVSTVNEFKGLALLRFYQAVKLRQA